MTRPLRACVLALLFPFGCVLAAVCAIFVFLPVTPTRVGLRNLRERLGVSPRQARALLARVYFQYVCYFAEILVLWPLGLLENVNDAEFQAFMVGVKARHGLRPDQGVMCVGAHFGNIEALGAALKGGFAAAGLKPFYALTKPSKSPFLEAIFERMRQGRGFLVLSTGGPRFKDKLREVAASGHGLALLADQKPRKGGLFVTFFGVEAAFPEKGIALGIEQGMAITYVTHRRLGLGRFELIFAEGPNAHLVDGLEKGAPARDADVVATFTCYALWLESAIRKWPTQWSWDYRKWSRKKTQESASEMVSVPSAT